METGNLRKPTATSTFSERLTNDYRYGVLQLCQNSNDVESWTIAQHLLDQCWTKNEVSETSSEYIQYICPGCGACLHPGLEGTCLRVARFPTLKTQRTRLRRMQRKKRQAIVSRQKSAKEHKSGNNKHVNSKTVTMQKVLLRDDQGLVFDRHHLMIQCGRCQTRIRRQGLKRELPTTKQAIQQNHLYNGKKILDKHQGKKVPSIPCDLLQQDKPTLDGDFLELPHVPSKASSTSARQSKSVPWKLQNSKKGKKKQNDGRKKGSNKLLDFLSSLND